MHADSTSPSARTLRDLNTDDLLRAAGLAGIAARMPAFRRLFDGPSALLARRLAVFDASVAAGEGPQAAKAMLDSLGTELKIQGAAPAASGPRLFVANHPGLGDFLALLSALNVPGLKVVARDRPFLRALKGVSESLFVVPERGAWAVLKQVSRHLNGGGAVLTFPAGRIEPDPAWKDSSASFGAWSDSTALWARTVPGLVVQPVIVAGVRARAFVDPWFARWRRQEDDREWTAAVMQLVCQVLWARPRTSRITVAFGEPLTGSAARKGTELGAVVAVLASGLKR